MGLMDSLSMLAQQLPGQAIAQQTATLQGQAAGRTLAQQLAEKAQMQQRQIAQDAMEADYKRQQMEHLRAQTDAIQHPVAKPREVPFEYTPEGMKAKKELMQFGASLRPKTGRGASSTAIDTPRAARTRRDIKDLTTQQIRSEHGAQAATTELNRYRNDRPDLANDGMAAAKTANDSSIVRAIQGAEDRARQNRSRAGRLQHSVDSAMVELQKQNAGGNVGGLLQPSGSPEDDFAKAAAAYQQDLADGAEPEEAQATYNQVVAAIARKHGLVK